MVQDARTIVRSCFETVFWFGALHKDPGFLEKFEEHGVSGKTALATALRAGELEPDEKGKRLRLESVANAVRH